MTDRPPAGDPRQGGASRVLVVGAGGMLGAAVLRDFARRGLAAAGTVRELPTRNAGWFEGLTLLPGIDLMRAHDIDRAIGATGATCIVNCAAVRQAPDGDPDALARMEQVNGEVPHRLAESAARSGAALVHISTDGVFNGTRAPYDETAPTSPADPYGRAKCAGEPRGPNVLTIRLSLIGRSLNGERTLVDWLLGLPQGAEISGFSRSFFSGLPVHEVARFLAEEVVTRAPVPAGLYHLAGPRISKAELIRLILARAGRSDVCVRDDGEVAIDRTLVTLRGAEFGGFRVPPWPRMIDDMFDFYSQLGLAV